MNGRTPSTGDPGAPSTPPLRAREQRLGAPSHPDGSPQDPTTVLLAVADHDLARALARTLIRRGRRVRIRGTGAAALAAVQQRPPGLLVADTDLPGVSGLQLCRRLRVAGRTMPVLLLGAPTTHVDRSVALDSGADAYLPMPFHLHQFVDQVRRLPGGWSPRASEESPATAP